MKFWWTTLFIMLPLYCIWGQEIPEKRGIWPHYARAQFAGNIGAISSGIGYATKKQRLQGELLVGYVPASTTDDHALGTITLKGRYTPWQLNTTNEKWSFYPIAIGLGVSQTIGSDDYFTIIQNRYPNGYYSLPTGFRTLMLFETRFERIWDRKNFHGVGAYLEMNVPDFYLINYIRSPEAIPFGDIFFFGCGIQWTFWTKK